MKIKIKATVIGSVVFCLLSFDITKNIFAMDFKDVKQNFWGYQYINDVATKGLITANAEGYFKPDNNISKFDTAKIFAKAAGYKYIDITSEEKNCYDNAYIKYKSLLDSCAKKYSKWSNISDREIAYLLDKKIFLEQDLDKFIVLDSSTEKLRALSKEEAAAYIMRLIRNLVDSLYEPSEARSNFVDSDKIASEYRRDIDLLYSYEIITGDENNKFNPNSAVTKTTLSVMVSKALKFISDANSRRVQRVESISGIIEEFIPGVGAVKILYASGERVIYKISPNATIRIDGMTKSMSELKENMTIAATLNDSVIVSAEVKSYSTQPEVDPNINLQSLSGIVESVSTENTKTLSVKIQLLNPSGGVITQIQKYKLANNCKINRGNSPVNLNEIKNGEIVKIEFNNETVYSITVEEKNKRINGVLLEKKYESGNVYLVIESSDNNKDGKKEKFELKVNNDTTINRRNNGHVSWSDLKIGDKVTVTAEYNNLTDVYAEGETATKDGWVEEFRVSKDGWVVVKIRDTDGKVKEYTASSGKVDTYALRVNNKVRIDTDSNEIESIYVLDKASSYYFGEVQRIFDNTIIRIKTDTGNEIEVHCNNDTKFKDQNGYDVHIGYIYRGDKVSIIMSDNSNYAKSVTIIYTGR